MFDGLGFSTCQIELSEHCATGPKGGLEERSDALNSLSGKGAVNTEKGGKREMWQLPMHVHLLLHFRQL